MPLGLYNEWFWSKILLILQCFGVHSLRLSVRLTKFYWHLSIYNKKLNILLVLWNIGKKMKIIWLIVWFNISVYDPTYITVHLLCVHRIKDQNPADIKLETIHLQEAILWIFLIVKDLGLIILIKILHGRIIFKINATWCVWGYRWVESWLVLIWRP